MESVYTQGAPFFEDVIFGAEIHHFSGDILVKYKFRQIIFFDPFVEKSVDSVHK